MIAQKKVIDGQRFDYMKRMQEAGLDISRINEDILSDDILAMYTYGVLGQEYDSALDYYEDIKGFVGVYLGALYVGVDEDNKDLINSINKLNVNGDIASAEIDRLKQIAAYKYLFNTECVNIEDKLLETIWSVFRNMDEEHKECLSDQEISFWWELIPAADWEKHYNQITEIISFVGKKFVWN